MLLQDQHRVLLGLMTSASGHLVFSFVSGSQNPDKVVENVVLHVGRLWGGKDPSLHSAREQ